MRKDIALILLILAILALIIVPLGPVMLDVLLSVNLTLAVLLLIVAVYLKNPADFSTFPTIILLGTAFRLALSIATTRQILLKAEAGQIIDTFGSFVIAGNIAVGLIIFLIITVFQFLVITKGAERVAEVSARFALDALPGKQMSIDADLRAESIDTATASAKRTRLERESQFFGSMDGAMKFVKGDAIAGLIIIFINLVGGVSVGMLIHQFSFPQAVETYTLLTLGDGLVAQLPALLMAMCAGIVTTRIDGQDNVDLGSDIWRDLVTDPRVPAAAAGIVVLIGLIPGFPMLNFLIAAGALLLVSFSVRRMAQAAQAPEDDQGAAEAAEADEVATDAAEEAEAGPARSDRLILCIGAGLAGRIDVGLVERLIRDRLERFYQMRGISFRMPELQILPGHAALNDGFEVQLDEVPVAGESVPPDHILLICHPNFLSVIQCPDESATAIKWHETLGFWVPETYRAVAEQADMPAEPVEHFIAQVFYRVLESNVGALFSQTEFAGFWEALSGADHSKREELEQRADLNTFYLTLRYLAEDGVPLRPARLVIDSYLHWLMVDGDLGPLEMAERLRGALKRQLCHGLSGNKSSLGAVLLDPIVEDAAVRAVHLAGSEDRTAGQDGLPLAFDDAEAILAQFREMLSRKPLEEPVPVVIAPSSIRRRLRNFLAANRVPLPVLAPHELSPEIQIHPVARISLAQKAAA